MQKSDLKARALAIIHAPNDSLQKTVAVALVISLVCSIVVAGAAVLLKPIQQENRKTEVRQNLLRVASLYQPGQDIDAAFSRIEAHVVNLDTGEYAKDINPITFNQRRAAKDPETSVALSGADDIAKISRRSDFAPVYLVRDEQGQLKNVIMPIHGYGLWSTMYAFVSLEADLNTVDALRFYQQGETPGLGAEVQNPKWEKLWHGKKVYNDQGQVTLHLIKGNVSATTPERTYKVDGLAGATLTSRGVSNMIKYWMGPEGFEPYLKRLAQNENR